MSTRTKSNENKIETRTTTSTLMVNLDLHRERENATFSIERLTHFIDGGNAAQTARRRYLEKIIANDPTGIFSNDSNMYLHRSDRHVRSLAKHVRLVELCRKLGIGSSSSSNDDDSEHENTGGDLTASPDFYVLLAALADDLPTALHWIMFVPNIRSLCNDEQQQEWLPLCRDWKMIGCYAQTELGHGSNVRALETTATFVKGNNNSEDDDDDGSFIIHSPTLTSAKFWPGTLGKTANHAMVIARLIDGDGMDRGMHNFLVPLRSMITHELLPGVKTGDIGPKIGYNVMDNGFATFDHVRIPRRYMAMRFAHVDAQGKYHTITTHDATSKVAYITMMQVRAYIVNEASKNLAMACTIAIRYSAVRRQGYSLDDDNAAASNISNSNSNNSNSNSNELQILDYKQQQHRLFPLLAASYCFFFAGKRVLQQLKDLEQELLKSSSTTTTATTTSPTVGVTKTRVADIHASTSALKSWVTMVTADGMEDCRKACGGHGFLQCSGLPELVTTYLQNPTVEGDNYMLPQQVVKVLIKLVQQVAAEQEGNGNNNKALNEYHDCDAGKLIPSIQAILRRGKSGNNGNDEQRILHCQAKSSKDLLDIPTLLLAYRHRAARLLVEVAESLQVAVASGRLSTQDAWNESLIQMLRVSKAYALYLLLEHMNQGIQQELHQNGGGASCLGTPEIQVLQDLLRLFALYWMERELGDFLEDGYLTQTASPSSSSSSGWIRDNVLHLLQVIRPNAVALVDARDFSDFRLKSALGRWDGNVYPAIMEAAKKDPLNTNEVGPGYEEHLKRLIVDGVGVYYTPSRL